jgi:hypothetical protein
MEQAKQGVFMSMVPIDRTVRQSLRAHICVGCEDRPEGSADWTPKMERPCEHSCTIFANLLRLEQIVDKAEGDAHVNLLGSIRETICLNCHTCESKGKIGQREDQCTCPLNLNHEKVTGLLQTLLLPVSGSD